MKITLPWIILVSSMAFFSVGSSTESPCSVSLPQKQDSSSCCIDLRQEGLRKNQMAYRLITQKMGIPFALVDLSEDQLQNIIEVDPFMRPFGISYKKMICAVIHAVQKYVKQELGLVDVGKTADCVLAQTSGIKEEKNKLLELLGVVKGLAGFLSPIQSFEEYEKLRTFFRDEVKKELGQDLPSDHEDFPDVDKDLLSDKSFAEQRLAGPNPMSVQAVRINGGGEGGLDWTDLKRTLNPSFNWDVIIDKVSKKGHLFALRYPLCDDLPKQIDITSINVKREMQRTLSPIALFVSRTGTNTDIFPVAIQMDYTPDSPVYTPRDGDDWKLAKLNVQTTDVIYGQMVEHLSKVHFVAEALCVSMKRHLADLHPLQQMLKFHCREVMIPNVFGTPALLNPITGFTRLLFATGKTGAELLVQRAYHYTTWNDTDFKGNLMDRGMWEKPSYFPYREDGKLIHNSIKEMVVEYVTTYYDSDGDVQEDKELQSFANTASAEGTVAPDGGEGKIKGFPSNITNRRQLEEVLTRIIWLVTGQHASVNYQLNDYVAFVPNMPFKTYRNKSNPHESSFAVLPNKATATIQVALTLVLSTLRCDELFDYGNQMIDEKGAQIVDSFFKKLNTTITETLRNSNEDRLDHHKLTYPYMIPKWLPNGIQT